MVPRSTEVNAECLAHRCSVRSRDAARGRLDLADSRDERGDVERFRERGAGMEMIRRRQEVGAPAYDDERCALVAELLSPLRYELGSAHERQPKIENDDIGLANQRKAQRVLPVEGANGFVTRVAKRELEQLSDRIVIFNDQDPEPMHLRRLRRLMGGSYRHRHERPIGSDGITIPRAPQPHEECV
jgi:hypothetical protein